VETFLRAAVARSLGGAAVSSMHAIAFLAGSTFDLVSRLELVRRANWAAAFGVPMTVPLAHR
jgi:hypothetical protein